ALHIAMAIRPDLGLCLWVIHERVGFRDTAIRANSYQFSKVIIDLLRFLHETPTITQGDEQITIWSKNQSGTEMLCSPSLGELAKNNLQILEHQSVHIQSRTCHCRASQLLLWLGIGKVNQTITRKIRIDYHIEQSSLLFV